MSGANGIQIFARFGFGRANQQSSQHITYYHHGACHRIASQSELDELKGVLRLLYGSQQWNHIVGVGVANNNTTTVEVPKLEGERGGNSALTTLNQDSGEDCSKLKANERPTVSASRIRIKLIVSSTITTIELQIPMADLLKCATMILLN